MCVIASNYQATPASNYLLAKQVVKLSGLAHRYVCVSGSGETGATGFWRDQGGPGQLLESLRSGGQLEDLLLDGLYVQGIEGGSTTQGAQEWGAVCVPVSEGGYVKTKSEAAALATHMFRRQQLERLGSGANYWVDSV